MVEEEEDGRRRRMSEGGRWVKEGIGGGGGEQREGRSITLRRHATRQIERELHIIMCLK